jgi:hypothetical protein
MANAKPESGRDAVEDDSDSQPTVADKRTQFVLLLLAAACVVFAVLHAFWPQAVDQTTAIFLGLAAAVLVIPQVTRIRLPGGTVIEKIAAQQRALKKKVQQVDQQVEWIEEAGLLPGRAPATEREVSSGGGAAAAATKPGRKAPGGKKGPDPNDPNKGKYGGSSTSNGRVLQAKIEPVAGERSAACRVHFWVQSTDPEKNPLTGTVTFKLHPTFNRWEKYEVEVKNGVAQATIVSWGAFTIGAEADAGATKLELDLMDVNGGTDKFYAS